MGADNGNQNSSIRHAFQMTDFLPMETEWILETNRDPPVYTRPMIGSELSMQQYWNSFDADGEVCIGVDFTSSLETDELRSRARAAFDKLRFVCPIIACVAEGVTSPRWVYAPSADRDAWLDLAFVVEERGASLNASEFVQSINFKRLPYTDANGTVAFLRAYLLTTSNKGDDGSKEYGLYLHGPHTIIDGGPGLHALNLMCEWMSDEGMDVRVDPSEEWKNLPVDPIAATGGLSKEWETSGKGLLQEFAEQSARTTSSLSLAPPSRPPSMSDPPFRYSVVVSEVQTAAIVAATKKLGISVSSLFHAAHCLAQYKMNPVSEADIDQLDFSSDATVAALERYLKPPIDPRTHIISSFTLVPLRFSMAQPLREPTERKRLLATAQMLQERFDKYLAHPCLPQLLAVMEGMSTTVTSDLVGKSEPANREADDERAPMYPWCLAFNNLGVVESKLRTRHGEIAVGNICVGNRLRNFMTVHMWSIHSKFCFQVQGNTAWGEECIKTLLDETLRIGLLVLDMD